MIDERSSGERIAWDMFGPPLYYCAQCLRKVKVSGGTITRKCDHIEAEIIAPRRAILAGVGGLSPSNKAVQAFDTAYSAVLGRTR